MAQAQKRLFSAEVQQLKLSGTEGQEAAPGPMSQERHDEIIAEIRKLREELASNGTSMSLSDCAEGASDMEGTSAAEIAEAVRLKSEIKCLSDAIETTKREIAALRYNGRDTDRISDVTSELDAVVGDTESATETILECCERIESATDTLELQASSAEERATVEDVGNHVVRIYEACNFQDITGQRISKVVGALKFIEDRISNMMDIWGGDAVFSEIDVPDIQSLSEEDMLLNGPARSDSDSASQAEIDALFD